MKKLINKLSLTLISLCMPVLVFAAENAEQVGSALNFRPPASDRSVIFLGNIFGVVDGVLAGTGSQIVGQMFGVFNAAVLSLGGIILVYTLMVSTMNTAHEGEMLGRKWSSIWVPLRSVFGIGLLLPKASGYCMMQIFVMWVVIQGVGAADKVWGKALQYLGRGGVIIQRSMDTNLQKSGGGKNTQIFQAAAGILSAQVCMLGIQHQVESLRQQALNDKKSGATGVCGGGRSGFSSSKLVTDPRLCSEPVPSFLNTVDIAGSKPKSGSTHEVHLPTFSGQGSSQLYNKLDGVCGVLKWNDVDTSGLSGSGLNLSNQSVSLTKQSRSMAVQQMWDVLSGVAQTMLDNNKNLNSFQQQCATFAGNDICSQNIYNIPFGAPLNENMKACSGKSCTQWGTINGDTALFTGTELQMAVASYSAVMVPSLNLIQNSGDTGASKAAQWFGGESSGKSFVGSRKFITQATNQGWIMAGAYFFKLAILNNNSQGTSTDNSGSSGLEVKQLNARGRLTLQSINDSVQAAGVFSNIDINPVTIIMGNQKFLKQATASDLGNDRSKQMGQVPDVGNPTISPPLYLNQYPKMQNTVFGYIINSTAMQLPGENFIDAPQFKMRFDFNPSMEVPSLPGASFSGGFMGIPGLVTTLIYNVIFRFIFNMLLSILQPILSQVFYGMLAPPMLLMSTVFNTAVKNIQNPDANPIIALAAMGSAYINGVANLWIELIVMVVSATAIPLFGIVFVVMMMLALPLVMSWITVMLSVGVMCAYYVPFVPFLLFTFASIAWLVAVIEAMVAAPIVALGVTHPEGHEAFGKGDQAIMLLLNVFLRPSMMIFGYIFGIMMTYVGVWVLNSGFSMVMDDIQNLTRSAAITGGKSFSSAGSQNLVAGLTSSGSMLGSSQIGAIYTQWTGTFFYFFGVLLYTTAYVSIAQKSFDLIFMLPDKILRWLSGGVQESFGDTVAKSMAQETEKGAQKGVEAGAKSAASANKAVTNPIGQASSGMGGEETGNAVEGLAKTSGS